MKPPPFDYERPVDTNGALASLASYGGRAKVLAGGQVSSRCSIFACSRRSA